MHREKRRAADFKAAADEARKRLEAALKEQRALARKLGAAESAYGAGNCAAAAAARSARQGPAAEEYWSEEAGRRFAVQQEELVALREKVAAQQVELERGGRLGTVAICACFCAVVYVYGAWRDWNV